MSRVFTEHRASVLRFGALLFLSGACALIFQIVWTRELRLIFGATTSASAAVLAIFMGGIGLGNAFLGRIIDRAENSIRVYGFLEIGVAICAAASPLLISLARSVYIGVGGQSELGTGVASVVRLGMSFIVLGLPTFLMGGTLPAAARAVSGPDDPRRTRIALLYGVNTLGAVAGAWLASFWLIEPLGNRLTLWVAAAVNACVALAALTLSRHLLVATKSTEDRSTSSEPNHVASSKTAYVLVVSGIVGFVFFLMEIVWYRMLGPLLGGTTYTFGLILCIALLGIGIGGAIYHWIGRFFAPTPKAVAVTCLLEATLLAVPLWCGDEIAIRALRDQITGFDSFQSQVSSWFVIGAFVIFPAALVSGYQFPLLIAVAGSGRQNVATHVGWTFAANTIGAILGSLAGGFVLLPMLTAPGLWRLAVILAALTGAGVMLLSGKRTSTIVAAVACLILCATGGYCEGPTAGWRHSGIGAGRADVKGKGRNAEYDFILARRRQCIWEAEGVESSVALSAQDSLSFVVNGKSDGNAYLDIGTQMGLGLIGPLLGGTPNQSLVVGLGTGETAGWLAACNPEMHVDVIELEPAIVEVAARCAKMNRDVLSNPKVQLHHNDAREFLLTSKSNYDLIVSEPSNPYRAGIANLFTREFYQAVSGRLNDGGQFVQWLQAYEVDSEAVKIVLKTLRSEFKHVEVWQHGSVDLLLVCTNAESGLTYDDAILANRLKESEALREGIRLAWRVADVPGIRARFTCGTRSVDDWVDEQTAVNTDDRNLLEYFFAKSVGQRTHFSLDRLSSLEQSRVGRDDDRRIVGRRRLAMHLFYDGQVAEGDTTEVVSSDLAAAYNDYAAARYERVVRAFYKLGLDMDCPIERIVFAHSLAEIGQPVPDKLLQRIAVENPAEASAIRGLFHSATGDIEVGVSQLAQSLQQFRESPWNSRFVFGSVFRRCAALAEVNESTARELFETFSEPFAMHRLEDERLMVRYVISEHVSDKATVEALSNMEPNVPWRKWLLKHRATVYESTQHPLASRAAAELRTFREWDR